jgi:hypothetical protein
MTSLKAKDLMPDLLVTVEGDATLEEAAGLMLQMENWICPRRRFQGAAHRHFD